MGALLAHFAIDLAGDFLLPHDAYDDFGHASRLVVSAGAFALSFGLTLRLLFAALDQARGAGTSLRAAVEPIAGRSPWRFVAIVVLLALGALVAMESLDVALSGERIDEISDLFGGSTLLGLTILIPTASLVAGLVWRALRAVSASHRAISLALGALFVRRALPERAFLGTLSRDGAKPRSASPPTHRAGLRAPPAFLA